MIEGLRAVSFRMERLTALRPVIGWKAPFLLAAAARATRCSAVFWLGGGCGGVGPGFDSGYAGSVCSETRLARPWLPVFFLCVRVFVCFVGVLLGGAGRGGEGRRFDTCYDISFPEGGALGV